MRVYVLARPIYHFCNHPIKYVKVTGVVVAVDEVWGRTIFTLDDSSGACIQCTAVRASAPVPAIGTSRHLEQLTNIQAQEEKNGEESAVEKKKVDDPTVQNPSVPWGEIDVGSVVRVKGKIGTYKDQLQVETIKIEVVMGLDAEVQGWNEVREFKRDVLGRPWVLTKKEEEECRRANDKELRAARRRAKAKDQRSTETREKDAQHVDVRKNRPSKDEPERDIKKRKDLERVQNAEGLVKRRKDPAPQPLASKKRSRPVSLAFRNAVAGNYNTVRI